MKYLPSRSHVVHDGCCRRHLNLRLLQLSQDGMFESATCSVEDMLAIVEAGSGECVGRNMSQAKSGF